jgi:hypothetical protein
LIFDCSARILEDELNCVFFFLGKSDDILFPLLHQAHSYYFPETASTITGKRGEPAMPARQRQPPL